MGFSCGGGRVVEKQVAAFYDPPGKPSCTRCRNNHTILSAEGRNVQILRPRVIYSTIVGGGEKKISPLALRNIGGMLLRESIWKNGKRTAVNGMEERGKMELGKK
ncbi:hypothetical protein CDAR_18531 [Caerostris darwini]|uniref:Uncharacterized protein n=1 Tax=Caerostris darwini TaxID=1538125 RepID=A0AAV4VA96_9ARAC|nr:hypothetical protein CDAR_18531 [Caerostris darwini]